MSQSPSTKRAVDTARSTRAPKDVAAQYAARNGLLRSRGYKNYGDYLRSKHWKQLRQRYRESDLPQECICGDDQVQLHHLTYVRVCAEELSDLTPLCPSCHTLVHVLEWRGGIGIDLVGLTDVERAVIGRAWLASEVEARRREAAERLAEAKAALLEMTFAARLVKVHRTAKARHMNVTSHYGVLRGMAKRGAADKHLTKRLRLIESIVYEWDDWA